MSARNDQGEGSVMRDEIKNPCKELWYENLIDELEAENAELKIKLNNPLCNLWVDDLECGDTT